MKRSLVAEPQSMDAEVKILHFEQDFMRNGNPGNNSFCAVVDQISSGQALETIYIKHEEPDVQQENNIVKEEPSELLLLESQPDESSLSSHPSHVRDWKVAAPVAAAGAFSLEQEAGLSLKEQIPSLLYSISEHQSCELDSQSRPELPAVAGCLGKTESLDVAGRRWRAESLDVAGRQWRAQSRVADRQRRTESPRLTGKSSVFRKRVASSQLRTEHKLNFKPCDYPRSKDAIFKQILMKEQGLRRPYGSELSDFSTEENDDVDISSQTPKHDAGQQFKCDLCDYSNVHIRNLKRHKAAKHRIGKIFKCNLCDYSSSKNHYMKEHRAARHGIGELLTCGLCDYANAQKSNLKQHRAVKHGIGDLFNCDLCDHCSATDSKLKQHKAAKHGIGKLIKCELCDYTNAQKSNLEKHRASEHGIGELFNCDLCDYATAVITNLKPHKAARHGMGELLKCDMCDHYYNANSSNLRRHKAAKHGVVDDMFM